MNWHLLSHNTFRSTGLLRNMFLGLYFKCQSNPSMSSSSSCLSLASFFPSTNTVFVCRFTALISPMVSLSLPAIIATYTVALGVMSQAMPKKSPTLSPLTMFHCLMRSFGLTHFGTEMWRELIPWALKRCIGKVVGFFVVEAEKDTDTPCERESAQHFSSHYSWLQLIWPHYTHQHGIYSIMDLEYYYHCITSHLSIILYQVLLFNHSTVSSSNLNS